MKRPELSVVIPVHNEGSNLKELYKRLKNVLEDKLQITYEIIFVEGGSEDDSWNIIEDMHKQNKNVKGIKFSRRFGHQHALKAGLDYSNGKAVVSIDGDLQQPPEMIGEFYYEWKKGYDIIYALRKDTKGVSLWKKATSRIFYSFLNLISDIKIEKGSSDFRLLDRKVVNELKKFSECQLFLRGIIKWVGYKSTSIYYVAEKRYSGKTKYTLRRMLHFAVDGVMSFSIRPLRLATILGVFISILSCIYIMYALFVRFIVKTVVPGWTSILISILFLGGIQLLSLGILGEYIGKLFLEAKRRQYYIVEKKTGL